MNVKFFEDLYKSLGQTPSLHIVLGSGLAHAFSDVVDKKWSLLKEINFSEVPGGKASSVQGHKGSFRYLKHETTKKILCVQVGRLHGYEGLEPWEAIQPVVASAMAGTQTFILSNAAGSLNVKMNAGSVMLIRDHVNMTGKNPLHGPNKTNEKGQALGPRFQDLSFAWNKKINAELMKAFKQTSLEVHEGVYLGLMGPTYETPAEVQLFHRWGLDAVGMSTVWECIALNYLSKTVGGFSFISNLGAGLSPNPLSHEEVEATAKEKGALVLGSLLAFSESHFQK